MANYINRGQPNVAVINTLGTVTLATTGGMLPNPPVVTSAGDSTCLVTLYPASSVAGAVPIGSFPANAVGAANLPNSSFPALTAVMSGSTAATVQIPFVGNANPAVPNGAP